MAKAVAESKAAHLKPIGDKILVELSAAEERTKSGIVLPDTAKEKPQQGKVVAVGSGKTLKNGKSVPPGVKVGDRIIFGKYSGNEVRVGDREWLIVNEDDILAVIH